MRNKFNPLRTAVFILLLSGVSFCSFAQKKNGGFTTKPFANNVFIEEHGQFAQRAVARGISFPEKPIFGVENAEFNTYFTRSGLTFQFAEYKPVERKAGEDEEEKEGEKEPGKRKFEKVWHTVSLKFVDANPAAEVVAENKVREYYNYEGVNGSAPYNFVPAYKKIKYANLYPGVDAEFELPAQGGIKYQFIVQPGADIPEISFELSGTENLSIDSGGALLINSLFGKLTDHAPTAWSSTSHRPIAVNYALEGNRVKFRFPSEEVSPSEGLVIDPWITSTTFPPTNSAFDIQEDGAGNVFVQGSTSNYQVQKYDPTGVLIWTYVTASIFLGDIAVDNPGNVYIVGGYPSGKRQKLDSSGVQQWVFPGLEEEWRLAFDYSKTVLTVGGYFIDPLGNNLGRFDTSTGAISNEIVYGAETRGIATDCNGDMFSLHVTFGYAGVATSNLLNKTNANFTPAGSVPSGFLLCEADPSRGYAPNPLYSPDIYQGLNALVVRGFYVYIYDGGSIRRFDKNTLAFINSVNVPNGSIMDCSGIAADYCGNIYAGTMNGIAVYDSTLTYQQTIAVPGVVYDILLGNTGNLLVCGAGFLGSFNITCAMPPPLAATTNTTCAGTGALTVAPTGGIGPYTYVWQPGGQTTATINNPPAGNYTYIVSDAFCHTYPGTATVNATPVAAFGGTSTGVSNGGANTVCAADAMQFTDNSTISSGAITGWAWDFGDGGPVDVSQNPQHVYSAPGAYTVTLIVTSSMGCSDTSALPVQVYPLPVANFTAPAFCPGVQGSFTNQSTISTGTVASYTWNFGDGSATSNLPASAHTYTLPNTYNVNLSLTSDNGCVHDTTITALVNASPVASFSTTNVCFGAVNVFTDLSTVANPSTISSWAWDIDNNGTVDYTTQNATYTYPAAGNYNVHLTVTSSAGCVDDTLIPVTVFAGVTANFSATSVCQDLATVFTDQSTGTSGNIVSWAWNLGDASTGSAQSPSHTYAAAGNYSVQLLVTSDEGCKDSITKPVTVYPLPVVGFAANPANGCVPLNAALNDQSTIASGSNVGWNWQIASLSSSAQQNSSYNFTTAGTYPVTLTVTSNMGCVDSLTQTITVYPLPVVAFTTAPAAGCAPLNVVLSDASTIATGTNVGWNWQAGGPFSSAQQNTSFNFTTNGAYNVTLTVTSGKGCVDSLTKPITVYPAPVVDFSTTPANGCVPLNATLNDQSTIASGTNAGWNWQIGNLSSSAQQNSGYNFTTAGTYPVTLTVTSDMGCVDSLTKTITVYPLPVVAFTTTPAVGCAPLNVVLNDASTITTGSNVGWSWQAGGPFSSAQQNTSFNFTTDGDYNVTLTVTSDKGCVDSLTKPVTVHASPVVDFKAVPASGCVPLNVALSDLSTVASGNIVTWNWQVGNLFNSTQQNSSFNFTTDGAYDVTLAVTSDMGCVSTLTRSDFIVVYPNPVAEFSSQPVQAELPDALVNFTDLSTGNPVQWSWQFGTGEGSTLQSPAYTYQQTGTFTVQLDIATRHGCTDSVSHTVYILPPSTIFIPNAFSPNGDGKNDTWGVNATNVKYIELQVFDRIGEKVFETNDINEQWDGTYRGKPLAPSVFVYQCTLVDLENVTKHLKGSVTLVR